MHLTPFLTDLDQRAAVKGSRDPLGIQQIWTRQGRHVVGNLTTVSDSVRDFTILLLGYYFAGQHASDAEPGTELATFLKWEQLAAYARAARNQDYGFRGTERVRQRLAEGSSVTISDDRAHQILSNQKTYGLWGLYSMPARASGLLHDNPPRLTPTARDFVERTYLPLLAEGCGNGARRIREILRPRAKRIDIEGSDAAVVKAIAKVLRKTLSLKERDFYREHLLRGGPEDTTQGLQQQLAELLDKTLEDDAFTWSVARIRSLAKLAMRRGQEWHPLAHYLLRIAACESVLAPSSMLFTHLLGLDGKSMESTTERLREAWGGGIRTVEHPAFSEIGNDIAGGDSVASARWIAIAETAALGRYDKLIELLMDQNKEVMSARGGAPWLEKRAEKLHVRFRDEQGQLPSRDELPHLWRFPYFLESLRRVAVAVKED
jgi:hypothetical protein